MGLHHVPRGLLIGSLPNIYCSPVVLAAGFRLSSGSPLWVSSSTELPPFVLSEQSLSYHCLEVRLCLNFQWFWALCANERAFTTMVSTQRDTDYKLSSSMKYLTLIKQGKTQHKVWELMEAQISTVLMDTGLAWLADVFFTCAIQIQESNSPVLPSAAPALEPASAPLDSPAPAINPPLHGLLTLEQCL